jgi:hypothetical protein
LKDQILRQLPNLLQDVESGISECESQCERLGAPRATVEEQRRYLTRISQGFSDLMKAAVDGYYSQSFFGSSKTDEGYRKRLRAVVQNTLTDFEKSMRLNGQTRVIVEFSASAKRKSGEISRSDYVNEVKELMRKGRGCELPGMLNPLIVSELFTEQCQPWRDIAMDTKDNILQAVYWATHTVLDYLATDETADGLFQIINGGIDTLKRDLNQKVAELLKPHYNGHPITYNHYLTDNVQKAQSDRRRRSFENALKEVIGIPNIEEGGSYRAVPFKLLTQLEQRTEVDMERYASDLAVDYMQAYYKVNAQHTIYAAW